MNCNKVRNLLFGEYADDNITPGLKAAIERHLDNCRECRKLALSLEQSARALRDNRLESAPEHLWYRIKDEIVKAAPAPRPLRTGRPVWLPLPRAVLATVVVLVLAGAVALRYRAALHNGTKPVPAISAVSYLAYLEGDNSVTIAEDDIGLGEGYLF